MKEYKEAYEQKLKNALHEYMEAPVTERTITMIDAMLCCYDKLKGFYHSKKNPEKLTAEEAVEWVAGMENADGTHGVHWSMADTNKFKRSEQYSDEAFFATMNMMYSDYCGVAKIYKVDLPDFYADLANAFLLDLDGGGAEQKLARYKEAVDD